MQSHRDTLIQPDKSQFHSKSRKSNENSFLLDDIRWRHLLSSPPSRTQPWKCLANVTTIKLRIYSTGPVKIVAKLDCLSLTDFFSLLLSTLNWHEQQRRNKEKARKNRKAISPQLKIYFLSLPLRSAVDLPTHAQLNFQRRLLLESWRCGGRSKLSNVQTSPERRPRCLLSNSIVVHRTWNLFINSIVSSRWTGWN